MRFVEDAQAVRVADVMTSKNLITVPMGTSLEDSKRHLHEHQHRKLLVVDENKRLRGLITMKDIDKVQKYPNACKDDKGRLRVSAAIGIGKDSEVQGPSSCWMPGWTCWCWIRRTATRSMCSPPSARLNPLFPAVS